MGAYMPDFVNRTEELTRLRALFDSDDAELAVVYGRRRIGKTRLVKQALEDHEDTVFYQTRQKTRTLQLEQFIETAADAFPGIEWIRQDWEPLFEYLADQDSIVILDEFPYSQPRVRKHSAGRETSSILFPFQHRRYAP
jgi:AAA+ ATPase superfamily predicted ATPase